MVVNEFGEVGLDHSLVAQSNDSVMVLENGCLCCTVRSDLIGTLNELYHSRRAGRIPDFDNVVIETSGLAEPGPVLQAFLSEPTLDGLYRVAQVVALVDAVNAGSTFDDHDEAVQQVALADRILITKAGSLERSATRRCVARAVATDQSGGVDRGCGRRAAGHRYVFPHARISIRPIRMPIRGRGSSWSRMPRRKITIIITTMITSTIITGASVRSSPSV